MKQTLLAVGLSFALIATPASRGQNTDAKQEQKILALIKEVQAQHAQMAENQAKIDAKLARIAEALRLARIYTSRER